MNIFVLDENPLKAAEYMHDSHVVKMILETAQLLSTAHRVLDGKMSIVVKNNRKKKVYTLDNFLDDKIYQATHMNHPSSVWVRESESNYSWLYSHFVGLLNEYTHRYGKIHKCQSMIGSLIYVPKNIPKLDRTSFAKAMPDDCKKISSVESYRQYYNTHKQFRANGQSNKYTKRKKPTWLLWG